MNTNILLGHQAARRLAGGALATLAATAGAWVAAVPANASQTVDCGYGDSNISSVTTDYFGDGTFEIHVAPTIWARTDGSDGMTYAMWHAVQSCVPGLYGDLAD